MSIEETTEAMILENQDKEVADMVRGALGALCLCQELARELEMPSLESRIERLTRGNLTGYLNTASGCRRIVREFDRVEEKSLDNQ